MALQGNFAELEFSEKLPSPKYEVDSSIAAEERERSLYSLPLQTYTHYAKMQRSYEERGDIDGLYDAQQKQLAEPGSNLTAEKLDAARQLRRANFHMVFFLITTDILGPTNAPYAMMTLGYIPGIIMYVAFGAFAYAGGYMLMRLFCALDSNNYPIRTYSDLAARVLGRWFRYIVAVLHFFQLLLNVGAICLTSGQALAQIIKSTPEDIKLCFTVCILIWAIVGMVMGQIRTLRAFSLVAFVAVWMNIVVCIITMVGIAKGPPNYALAKATYGVPEGPIIRQAVTTYTSPGTSLLSQRIGGINQMVFAWGGATVFCEILAEMKRPGDFWKGLLGADLLIGVVYLIYGVFVFSYQGQFTYATANMGITQYNLQTAGNVLTLVSGVFAAVLYGNVGMKVLYQGFLVPNLRFPMLMTKSGALVWAVFIVAYWAIAFVIARGIPIINDLVSLIGALCIINFSYTFPFLFTLVYLIRKDAASLDSFDSRTDTTTLHDTWMSWSRWRRGFFTGRSHTALRGVLALLTLCSLTLSGLGMYGAITEIIDDVSTNLAKGFGCTPNIS